jgi:RNAse (barnase) inhibitor barstar
MRTHKEILQDIYNLLLEKGFEYEFKSLKNEEANQYTSTELIGEILSVLLKMNEKITINKSIGHLITEFNKYANQRGIYPQASKYYSIEQKEFDIDGNNFTDLKGFYNAIGNQLVDKNDWGKNWNAFNDMLRGGFIKTEYGEPFILRWKNAEISKSKLEDFQDFIDLIKEQEHITLLLE